MRGHIDQVHVTRGAARYRARCFRRQRLLCSCLLLAVAVAALIIGWPSTWGACLTGVLALAATLLAPLDPP